ncbi:MAG: YggS family pyridoxal phosphate-dependent enzyme [Nitrospirae bacterium]|nr:YggS family pyridoxal phosphate-dependent enzyme [Nitrospirota bacterium]
MSYIAENVKAVRTRIEQAAKRSGRDVKYIKLIAVTKTVDINRIKEAVEAGLKIFGENRVQEAQKKVTSYELRVTSGKIEWHFIGHLQTNKVKDVVGSFELIHAVDSLRLSEEIDRQAKKRGIVQDILIEVKLSEEESKYGITEEELLPLIESVSKFNNIKLLGLMAIPPFFDDAEKTRPYFKRLRELRDEAVKNGFNLPELSMGMSHDFETAIEEGATMVRIGTAIFGERK